MSERCISHKSVGGKCVSTWGLRGDEKCISHQSDGYPVAARCGSCRAELCYTCQKTRHLVAEGDPYYRGRAATCPRCHRPVAALMERSGLCPECHGPGELARQWRIDGVEVDTNLFPEPTP
jgi:hypothetical protein